jgi:hypothetical protein
MKIYTTPKAPYQMRVKILRRKDEPTHIRFVEVSQEECLEKLKAIIVKKLTSIPAPTTKCYVTNVEVREGEGNFNGKCISFSFKGLSPKEVLNIFLNEFKE